MSASQSERPTLADQVAELEEQGVTSRADQAAALEVPLSTFMRRLNKAGLTEQRVSRREWIPWTVAERHHHSSIHQRLGFLTQAAQERDTPSRLSRAQAIRWATKTIEQDLDVTYSSGEGFILIPANPDDWYLRRLLDAALRYVLSLPQLDELGTTATDLREDPK